MATTPNADHLAHWAREIWNKSQSNQSGANVATGSPSIYQQPVPGGMPSSTATSIIGTGSAQWATITAPAKVHAQYNSGLDSSDVKASAVGNKVCLRNGGRFELEHDMAGQAHLTRTILTKEEAVALAKDLLKAASQIED